LKISFLKREEFSTHKDKRGGNNTLTTKG